MNVSHPQPPVNGDDEPRSKRQRIALACDPCRARKTRCDGARPACGVCIDMDFDCLYQRPARTSTSSSQDKEYVSRIEDRLHAMETLLHSVVGKIELRDHGDGVVPATAPERLQTITTPQRAMVLGTDTDTIYADANELALEANLQDDTVDGMGVITFSDELSSAYFGPTSNSAFFNHITNAMPEGSRTGPQHTQAPSTIQMNVNYISRPSSPPPLSLEKLRSVTRSASIDDAYALPPKSKIINLVNRFFTETGMLFPYIYKKWVLDGLAGMNQTHLHGVRRSWLCLLNTIMAFATFLAPVPNDSVETGTPQADVFLQRALKLLPNITLKPANLEMFQALLLMTQCLQGTQCSAQTWNLHRLTVQAAFQVGVHSSTGSDKYSPLEREIRKRSWYMCFILDKTCSMTFGRPPTIPNSYVLQELPLNVELELLDEPHNQIPKLPQQQAQQSRSTVVVYIQSIKIYHLVAETIDKVYRNNIESDVGLSSSDLFQRILSIEQKLSSWKSELPLDLQVRSKGDIVHDLIDSPVFSQLSAVITLRYLNTRILLHRPILARFLDHDDQKPGSAEEWAFLQQFGKSSLEVSILSALELIAIIHSVSECQHRMLTTWWFSIYYTFSAALVVFSGMVVYRKHGIRLPSYEHYDLSGSLQKAFKSLENIGHGTRMAIRCQKYLRKLIQIAAASGMANGLPEGFLNVRDQIGPGMRTSALGLSDLSPIDLDVGPDIFGCDWDRIFPLMN